ncbi:MAG: class I SAM-dependent methyltransferase, partial [Armatimonadota bacterium]
MRARNGLLLGFACLVVVAGPAAARAEHARLARHLIDEVGGERGVWGVLGARDMDTVLALARSSGLLLHVREPDAGEVEAARKVADRAGLYGTRIIVEEGPLDDLPYADNLLDAVICTWLSDRDLDAISWAEVRRVLRPGGTAILGRARL